VTLVLTVGSPESIWLIADRRLSYKGWTPKDDARKIMLLETTDGVAILGYAGLGATARGTEPADWMSAILRTRNLPLEQSLGILADAMKREFPRHMVQMPGAPAHSVIIPAFVNEERRLYSIDLVLAANRKNDAFRYTRHIINKPTDAIPRTVRLAMGGSGALYLAGKKNKFWMRDLLRLVNACDRGRLSPYVVADELAALNHQIHLNIRDGSVGSRCIVVWRNRKRGVQKGGGAHQFYTRTTRDNSSPTLPQIGTGIDVEALIGVVGPRMFDQLKEMLAGRPAPDINREGLDEELSRLPDKPDENLR